MRRSRYDYALRALLVLSTCLVITTTAAAQFKTIGPPPFSDSVARQKIRTLLDQVDAGNRKQTIETLTGYLAWYRNIIGDELIAAWQKDGRANLPEVMKSLADSRVAAAVVEYSWRQQRDAAFQLAYAPMFADFMIRSPESAKPFLDDLLATDAATGQPGPVLSDAAAQTVSRILLDMPDIGAWKQNALRILPHYRAAVETLLAQDKHSDDPERRFRAMVWESDLKLGPSQNPPPGKFRARPGDSTPAQNAPAGSASAQGASARSSSAASAPDGPPAASGSSGSAAPAGSRNTPTLLRAPFPAGSEYHGPMSGTLKCIGGPIPQNAEYVFQGLPVAKLELDFDTKVWEARLTPGDGPASGNGQTLRLSLRNKSSSPQKRCTVHWSVIP